MAVIDTIDGYNLRKDTLINYLRKLFPGDSITAEMSDGTVYRMRIPRALIKSERDAIIALRESSD